MKSTAELVARGALGLLLGVSIAAGCAGSDTATEETESTELVQTPDSLAEQEASLTSVDQVDCGICAIARACCHAVYAANGLTSRASSCNNFDAQRCATLDPGRQRTTKINCLVQLRTTISAWRLAGRAPPSACYIPGE
jgi:hypothetical protein